MNELTRADWRVLGAVMTLTASYSRTCDFVYVAEIAREAGFKHERQARGSIQRLVHFGVIEWEAGRGRGAPSLLSLPPVGKGGRTVVMPPVERKRTTGYPPLPVEDDEKPDTRNPAYGGPTPEKVVREVRSSQVEPVVSYDAEARPDLTQWTCQERLRDGDTCGSTFTSEAQLERHKHEAHWSGDLLELEELFRARPA